MSLNVSLPPELEKRVRLRVESGLYSSASEVIREALRMFEAYEDVRAANLAALQADIASGQFGEVNVDDLKMRGRAMLASRARS